jgi:GT2 family glycosyltransferase
MQTRIIVATLGDRETIKETLKSIATQNVNDLEIKIVTPKNKIDHLNTIATKVNLRNYQIIEDEGKGLSAAINQGFSEEGNFDFFSWLNDDDELTLNSLNRSIQILNLHKNASAVVGHLAYEIVGRNKININATSKLRINISRFGPNLIPQPGSLIRRNIFENQSPLNPNHKFAMDLDMWLRILKTGEIEIIKEIQGKMKWHVESITYKFRKDSLKEAHRIRCNNTENYKQKILVNLLYLPTNVIIYLVNIWKNQIDKNRII